MGWNNYDLFSPRYQVMLRWLEHICNKPYNKIRRRKSNDIRKYQIVYILGTYKAFDVYAAISKAHLENKVLAPNKDKYIAYPMFSRNVPFTKRPSYIKGGSNG